ncbi:hypothetical protein KBB96_05840 [Luteolibacter ambystomatis]|uniref:PEP-CTERM sorting domain-containing protein n=1 Tax=Luteolibacter ambystomatis TaxID=2824561 RepID=A0A975J1P6_9BACT|nr:hypothetical protein [Luteolibacter ambystomatis]QUE52411.1 hypothetical protein KBB96_05840 [Luteolibacter ambystomatis]
MNCWFSPTPAFRAKALLHATGILIGIPLATSAATLTVTNPNFDQGTGGQLAGTYSAVGTTTAMGPSQIGTSGWYGRANVTNSIVSGFRPAIVVNSGSATGMAAINFAQPSAPGSLAGSEMPEADLWQVLTGTPLVANTSYTLGVDVDAGSLLSIGSFSSVGFGIGVSTGGSTSSTGTLYMDSLSNPSLADLSLISGTTQRLSLTFTTGAIVPGGDLGIVIFGGRGSQAMSGTNLYNFRIDNVTLDTVPETSSLALCALGVLPFLRRRR